MNKKVCVIFGAGNEFPESISLPENRLVIAADGGLEKLSELRVKPDIVVGDFDSLGRVPDGENVKRLPCEKDTTDMYEAVRLGTENGCEVFHIYGGAGGRLDHTIANLQLAAGNALSGRHTTIFGEGYVIETVCGERLLLPARKSGYVSVFALCDVCGGVCISGLKYELNNGRLTNTFALGVSNEFVGKEAAVSCATGALAVYYEI